MDGALCGGGGGDTEIPSEIDLLDLYPSFLSLSISSISRAPAVVFAAEAAAAAASASAAAEKKCALMGIVITRLFTVAGAADCIDLFLTPPLSLPKMDALLFVASPTIYVPISTDSTPNCPYLMSTAKEQLIIVEDLRS
ncbi:hypothetical protein AAC387_Pa09g2107 [Persea americana]